MSNIITSFVTIIPTSDKARCSLNGGLKLKTCEARQSSSTVDGMKTNKINSRFPINSWNINLQSSLNKTFSHSCLFSPVARAFSGIKYAPFVWVRDGRQFKLIGLDFFLPPLYRLLLPFFNRAIKKRERGRVCGILSKN